MSVSPRLKRYAKRVGTAALVLVALDVAATAATVGFGAELLKL